MVSVSAPAYRTFTCVDLIIGKSLIKDQKRPLPIVISIENHRINKKAINVFLLTGTMKNFLISENLKYIKIKITKGTTGDKLTSFSQNSYLLPISQNKMLSAGMGVWTQMVLIFSMRIIEQKWKLKDLIIWLPCKIFLNSWENIHVKANSNKF